ncbi:MAG: ABC transporter substrate-binding protein [Thermodesulfobacteriota bacterium]
MTLFKNNNKKGRAGQEAKPLSRPGALFLLLTTLCIISGCTPNNPYRASERGKNIFYSTFNEPPKHLDPARSYSSDEYRLIAQIYEPPLQYHYLKRPYELVPLTAVKVPQPEYFDRRNNRLPRGVDPARVARAEYEIKIKRGVMYEEHPAFARSKSGKFLYRGLGAKDLKSIESIKDFPEKGTRELKSDDFILQIKRLADPLVESPILPILEKYILGLRELSLRMRKDLEEIRAERRARGGASYNQALDERSNPILFDYARYALAGVRKVDDHTYRIILKKKYPQFIYWLAMPFFSPMPVEAVRFYGEGALAEKNITLDRYPVGTGPYVMDRYNPNMEIILKRNKRFHGERYPSEGAESDRAAGLLSDGGKRLPFIEKIVLKIEKEAIPRWNKFTQGYYDNSGITSESFDQAVTFSPTGRAELTPFMREKGIRLVTSVEPSTFYAGFNMLDSAVGGYTPEKQKLRRAISIALDYEEYIEIFNNGRGIPASSPLPPGIFGHGEGRAAVNPYIYRWDERRKRPVRRSIEYAKKLLAEAGYPGGRDASGRPLTITFDNPWTGPGFTTVINWYIKRFKLLGIQLVNRTTDYNRFQEKMLKGNFQFFVWGWNADYPDPENFLFLLTGSNSKKNFQGENVANYSNPDFDRLFKKMENMDNSPARLRIIKELVRIIQKDAPWVWGYHPVSFVLYHDWVKNVKPNAMANNTLKYIRLDAARRRVLREQWNRPVIWPVAALFAVLIIIAVPAVISLRRKRGG